MKISIRSYKKDEYIIRFHNLDDNDTKAFFFKDPKENINFILNKFINSNMSIITNSIKELGLSTNQFKSDILKNKYSFRELDNLNLTQFLRSSNLFCNNLI